VDRNRIKRLVREYFRTQVRTAPAGRPLDYVVMARSAVRQTDGATLRDSLARHFRRIQQQAASGNDTDQPVP
jgi:ribonuclease P protein component